MWQLPLVLLLPGRAMAVGRASGPASRGVISTIAGINSDSWSNEEGDTRQRPRIPLLENAAVHRSLEQWVPDLVLELQESS